MLIVRALPPAVNKEITRLGTSRLGRVLCDPTTPKEDYEVILWRSVRVVLLAFPAVLWLCVVSCSFLRAYGASSC